MDVLAGLRRACRQCGDRPAVIDGDTRLTWRAVDDRTAKLASGLRGLGLGPGDRVAILMLNSVHYLELYYGIPRVGGVYVPLNTRLAPAELRFLLEDSGAPVLVVDDTFAPLVEQIAGGLRGLPHVIHVGTGAAPAGALAYEELLTGAQSWDQSMDVRSHEDDVVGIFYTGGTTGKAKGVMLTHRNLVANALHVVIHSQFQQEENFLHAAPMFHIADAGGVCALAMVGACHTILPRFDPVDLLETIQRERVTRSMLVPTMINALLQVPMLSSYDLSSWRHLTYGASPMAPELLRRTMALLPCALAQGYGQTEAAPLLTWLSRNDHQAISQAEPGSPWASRLESCGQAVIGVELRVVDEEDQDVGPGEVGEIIARGPNVMKGYWNRPEETTAALRAGWLRTGDLARMDDEGYLYIVDRKKDMIISGAENVFSVEVENALCAHPAVLEAAVIGVPDERWGERVHAVVALKPEHAATVDDLIAFCRTHIAGFKVPRSVEFMDALPKSGAGKILKRDLRAKYWQGEARHVG